MPVGRSPPGRPTTRSQSRLSFEEPQEISPSTKPLSNPCPAQSKPAHQFSQEPFEKPPSTMSRELQEEEFLVVDLNRNHNDVKKFVEDIDKLKIDGSNFAVWRRRTETAVYEMTNVSSYWVASPADTESRLEMAIDKCGGRVIYATVCEGRKDLVAGSAWAHNRMAKLNNFFKKGGRTAQYAIFKEMIFRSFDPTTTDLITHINEVHQDFDRLESEGFKWTKDNLIGMFYQLGAPATGDFGMDTVNTQLDAQTRLTNQEVTSEDVRAAMQANITSRKMALGLEGSMQPVRMLKRRRV